MILEIEFEEESKTLDVDFGEVQDMSDGGYEKGLAEGEAIGHAKGYEDGYKTGVTDGKEQGYNAGFETGKTEGYTVGHTEGYAEGKTDGYSAGHQDGVGEGVEQGKQAEYDSFWDVTQRNGERKDWEYAFSGIGWTDDNYNPKYTIRGAITSAFRRSSFTNTLVPVIVVGGTANAFNASLVATIPSIDLTEATNTATCFNNANRLVDVAFAGTIPTTINMQFASGLSVASMKSAILHLANYSGTANANVNSLFFSEDCWTALEADSTAPDGGTWKKYVDTLGWNT